jgi:hypothetical protein
MPNKKKEDLELCALDGCQRPEKHRGKHRRVDVEIQGTQEENVYVISSMWEWDSNTGKNRVEVQQSSFYLGDALL